MKNKIKGFTFLEIIIAISILMILALLAIPTLKERKARAHVDGAVQIGLKDAQFLQKWFTITGRYSMKNSSTGGCPNLPFRFYPDSNIESKISGYSIKVESMFYFSTNPTSCKGNKFMIIGEPICGTIVESMGVICIDQDANVTRGTNKSCNNSGGRGPCIWPNKIPDDSGNIIPDQDESEGGNPDVPPDDIPDPSYCAAHPLEINCQTPAYCSKYSSEAQEQCKCVLDYKTNPNCQKVPDENNCTGDNLLLPRCACSVKKSLRPDWCQTDVDCSKTPDSIVCEDECKKDNTKPFCSCWIDPTSQSCQDACKSSTATVKPKWCTNENWCILNHSSPECQTPQACKDVNYATDECKCLGSNQPDWCKNINPDDDFCQAEANKWHPSCRRHDEYIDGSPEQDSCNNNYVCIKATLCNGDKSKYAPGTGTDWQEAWKLNTCANGQTPNYPNSDAKFNGYKKGDVITTLSCETYTTDMNINKKDVNNPENQPDAQGSPWIRNYSNCHVDNDKYSYKIGDIVILPDGNKVMCIDASICNFCNPDGSDQGKKTECSQSSGWQR